jgi:DNA-binding transcriptional ArsR family regulator
MSDESVNEVLRQRSFPLSHTTSQQSIQQLRDLQHERAGDFLNIIDAVRVDERRKILACLCRKPNGATYNDLDELLTVQRRTIRHHVSKLVDDEIVVREGNPAFVRFVDQDIEVLAKEAISIAYASFE